MDALTKTHIVAMACGALCILIVLGALAGAVVYWDAHSYQTPCVVNVGPRDGCK